METLSENMRWNVNYVTSLADQSANMITNQIECGFLSTQGEYFILNQSLSQGMNLLTTKVHDVVSSTERESIMGRSKESYLNLDAANGSFKRQN